MNEILHAAARWLDDDELLRQAVERTARDHGFAAELVEKDFFCSLVVAILAANMPEFLVFKGGTCLSKVYEDFYRLSEDLDFAVSTPPRSSRTERHRLMEPVKALCERISSCASHFVVLEPLHGANQSSQYIQALGYQSRITGSIAQIRLEFGLREPTILAPLMASARTLLTSPVTGTSILPAITIRVMALKELWSEKIRAALCRRQPAIRDYFDVDFACIHARLNLSEAALIDLVRTKLSVPGNGPLNLSAERLAALEKQVKSQLRPVLRSRDFARFDLQRIWNSLVALADRVQES